MAVDESLKKLDKIFDQNIEITGTLTVGGSEIDFSSFLTSYTETDPVFGASAASGITSTNITNWNTAYGWGNHADGGYQAASSAITTSNIGSQSVNYSTSAGNADTVDGYHASNLWRSDGATWNPSANVILSQSANSQEWSFDIIRNGYSGGYWQVWDSSNSTMLKVDAVNGKVYAPYNFVGNLEGNASSASSVAWGNVTSKPSTFPPSGHDHDRAFITDTRGAQRAPSYYDDRYVQWDFQNYGDTGAGGDGWHVLQTISPWSTYDPSHRQQQLVFTGTGGIKFRYATSDSAWAGWQTIITSDNIGSQSVSYASDAGTLDGIDSSSFFRDNQDRRLKVLRFTGEGGDSGNSSNLPYAIYQEGGAWTWPYPDLRIAMHTGIKFGANSGYYGMRFYTDYDMSSQVMSINNGHDPLGGGNVYVNNSLQAGSSLRAPVFYDSNDTNWWIDPAASSSAKFRQFVQIGDSSSYNTNSGSWGARLNVTDNVHAKIDVAQDDNGMHSHWFAHTGQSTIKFGTTSAHGVEFISNNQGRGQITSGGTLEWWNNISAPTYYDYDNTGYYLNAASTSNLYGLSVASQISGSVNGTSNAVAITGYGNGNFTFHQTSSAFNVFSGWHNYLISNHGNGSNYYNTIIAMPFWGSPRYSRLEGGTQRGPYEFWTSERTIDSSYDIYAPAYYDKDNSAYYLNPGSTDTSINVRGVIQNPSIWINDGDNYNSYNENIRLFNPANGVSVIAFAASGTSGTPTSSILGYSDRHEVRIGDTWRTRVYGGYLQVNGDARATLFYDSNNTGYYVDPASTSYLNTVSLGAQTWRGTITWNSGVNINVNGECSIDMYGGQFGVWNSNTQLWSIRCPHEARTEIGQAGSRGLYVYGTMTASGDVVAYSDVRVKENIKTIDNALDKVNALRGVEFNKIGDTKKSIGVIAQEIEKVLPEVVREEDDGMKAVAYGNIVGVLIEAVKELSNKVEELENQLKQKQ